MGKGTIARGVSIEGGVGAGVSAAGVSVLTQAKDRTTTAAIRHSDNALQFEINGIKGWSTIAREKRELHHRFHQEAYQCLAGDFKRHAGESDAIKSCRDQSGELYDFDNSSRMLHNEWTQFFVRMNILIMDRYLLSWDRLGEEVLLTVC